MAMFDSHYQWVIARPGNPIQYSHHISMIFPWYFHGKLLGRNPNFKLLRNYSSNLIPWSPGPRHQPKFDGFGAEEAVAEAHDPEKIGKSMGKNPKHFPTSPLGQYCAGSLLLNFGGQKRSGAFRRIWPSAALGKLLKLTGQAICISRCQNRCSFAL